jgi:TonB family protein
LPLNARRVDDFYPLAAVQQGISGNVELEYTVMPDGRAHNPRVIIGLPPGAFDQPAKNVLFNSVFKPRHEWRGRSCTVRVRVRFTVKGACRQPESQLVKARTILGRAR